MQAALDDHCERHPDARPGLGDLVVAAAELDGHPLADEPERIRQAAAQVVAQRKRRAAAVEVAVPTAVRVEAGWDRTSSAWAFPNRLRITDMPLDSIRANTAASIHHQTRVSVADAHLGAVIQSAVADRITG
jgi:hypothetical protein